MHDISKKLAPDTILCMVPPHPSRRAETSKPHEAFARRSEEGDMDGCCAGAYKTNIKTSYLFLENVI